MKKWEKLNNHYLLFNGTKIFNYIGVFSNGLKIAPPEASSTDIYMVKVFILLINLVSLLIIVIHFIIKMRKKIILIFYNVKLL